MKAAGSCQPANQLVWQYFKFPRFGARQGSLPHSSAHALLFSQLTYARPCFLMSCLTCPRCDQQRRLNSRRSNHLAKCLHRIRARSSWLEAVWLGAPSMTWPKAHWVGGSGGRRRCATKASFCQRFFISARRCPGPAQQTPLNFHRVTWRANCLHFIRNCGACKKTGWIETSRSHPGSKQLRRHPVSKPLRRHPGSKPRRRRLRSAALRPLLRTQTPSY